MYIVCYWYVPISFKFMWFFIISMVELQIAIKSNKKVYFLDHKNDWWVQIYDSTYKYANTSLKLPFWNGFLYNKILKVCTVGDVMRSGFFSESEQKKNRTFWVFDIPKIYYILTKCFTKTSKSIFFQSELYICSVVVVWCCRGGGGRMYITFLAFFQKYHRNINTKKYK